MAATAAPLTPEQTRVLEALQRELVEIYRESVQDEFHGENGVILIKRGGKLFHRKHYLPEIKLN
jgi:hypothetical protein